MNNTQDTPMYAIAEPHLKIILENLSHYPYKDVHMMMLILESLPKIVNEEVKQDDKKPELLVE